MYRIRKLLLAAFTLPILILGWVFASTGVEAKTPDSDFWIDFIDVGQGDAALIQCDGHYMMIDGGPSSASSLVYTILMDEQIKNLDVMIATHPDEDHIGGLSGALNYATVETVYSPVTEHDTKTFKSLLKYIGKQGVTLTVPDDATVFKLGSAEVEILGPVTEGADTNNNSIVTRITYGSNSFLFMGDAEFAEEYSLIKARKDVSCDVIKIGHHGSKTSSTYALINTAKPAYAVISAGKNNEYGHPTEEVLKKLSIRNIEIYRTDQQGDVFCMSDGENISFETEKRSKKDLKKIPDMEDASGENSDSNGNNSDSKSGVGADLGIESTPRTVPDGTTYVLNISSKKFHIPTCDSVSDMAEKNKAFSDRSADEIIALGYKPCQRCKP